MTPHGPDAADRLTEVVVLPTPPFLLITAVIMAFGTPW